MKTKNTESEALEALAAVLRHFNDPKLFAVNCAANAEVAARGLDLLETLRDGPRHPRFFPNYKVH